MEQASLMKELFGDEDENDQLPDEHDAKTSAKDARPGADEGVDDLFDENGEEEFKEQVKHVPIPQAERQRADALEEHPVQAGGSSARSTSSAPMELHVPEMPRPPPDAPMFLVKLPNILGIEPKPFSAETYEDEEYENREEDEEGNSRIRLRKDNVIRWRYVRDDSGNVIDKESNGRLVKWSDGSWQLYLGTEVFDVLIQDVNSGNPAPDPLQTAGKPTSEARNGHLFTVSGSGGALACHGRLSRKMIFRPATLSSKSHKKLTSIIQQTHMKEKKVKMIHTERDPEKERLELERIERERERNQARLDAAQRRKNDQYAGELSANFLESVGAEPQDDDDEEDSRQNRRRAGDDSDEDEYETGRFSKRLRS
eukprot:tig00020918_g15880.t1